MPTKHLRYDRHARRRMKWRKISETEVEETLQNPDKEDKTTKGCINRYKTIGQRYIRVTYKEFEDEILVISAVDKTD
ncbi:MAG: DUF4258 domain-containing protein [bacterium]